MIKKLNNSFFYCLISLIVSSIIGIIALTTAYSLPIETIRKNSEKTLDVIAENNYFKTFITNARPDYFTDLLMINTASIKTKNNPFVAALLNSRYNANSYMENNLYYSLNSDIIPQDENIINYPRYWHGYLMFLKPLLTYFDLSKIRVINTAIQIILLFSVLFLFYKRLGIEGVFAFLFMVLFLNPSLMGYCLVHSSIYYVLLISTLSLLICHDEYNWKIFLWTGIATAFFDFLTFPIVPVGVLLITSLLLYDNDIRKNIVLTVIRFIAWVVGYLGMWSCKWVIASIFTPINVIKDAFDMVLYRMFGDGSKDGVHLNFGFFDAIKLNFEYINQMQLWLALLGFTLLILMIMLLRKKVWKNNWNALLIILIGLMPFVWYIFVAEHSIIHPFFVHKDMAISAFALMAVWISCFKKKAA